MKKIGPNLGFNIYSPFTKSIWKIGEYTPNKFNEEIKDKFFRPLFENIFNSDKKIAKHRLTISLSKKKI